MSEREQFEVWYSDSGSIPKAIEKYPSGEYSYMGAAHAWSVWQACAESKQSELAALKQENANISAELDSMNVNLQGWIEKSNAQKKESQALREQKPVAWMYKDSCGKYSTPMLELRPDVPGYHKCWKPEPLYSVPVPASEWMPIELAPKDGTEIIGCNNKGVRCVTRWSKHNHVPVWGWIRQIELYGEEVDGFDPVLYVPLLDVPKELA